MLRRLRKCIPPKMKTRLLKIYYWFLKLGEDLYTMAYGKVCRIQPGKVVFCNFFGRPYGDNPKYIADELLRRNLGWDLVWLVKDPSLPLPEGVRAVRYGTSKALREMATAKFVVDNVRSSIRPPKKRGQVYLQTWHGGLGFKAVEGAVPDLDHDYVKAAKRDGKNCDGIVSSCGLQTEEFQNYFWLNEKTEILEIGLPRNDKLFDPAAVSRMASEVRRALQISEKKKIVLYMPTFRDDRSVDGYRLDHQGVLNAFEKRFGEEFVMVIRLHPNVQDQDEILPCDERIINATRYPDAQELYMAADYLITDYSSSAFDFSLLGRPVILCALDYEKYRDERGLTDIFRQCPYPKAFTNGELTACIEAFSPADYQMRFDAFKRFWRPFDKGKASKQVVDWMIEKTK